MKKLLIMIGCTFLTSNVLASECDPDDVGYQMTAGTMIVGGAAVAVAAGAYSGGLTVPNTVIALDTGVALTEVFGVTTFTKDACEAFEDYTKQKVEEAVQYAEITALLNEALGELLDEAIAEALLLAEEGSGGFGYFSIGNAGFPSGSVQIGVVTIYVCFNNDCENNDDE